MFLEISQNWQENTCATVSFLIKLQALGVQLYQKDTVAQVFSCEFCEISKNTFFYGLSLVAASVHHLIILPKTFLVAVTVMFIHSKRIFSSTSNVMTWKTFRVAGTEYSVHVTRNVFFHYFNVIYVQRPNILPRLSRIDMLI